MGNPDSIQIMYNLLIRGGEQEIIPWAVSRGISVTAYSPLCQGLLAGKISTGFTPLKGDAREKNRFISNFKERTKALAVYFKLKQIAEKTGVTPASLALNWTAARPGIGTVLTGSSDPKHIKENSTSFSLDLSSAVLQEINSLTESPVFKRGICFFY